MRAATGGELSLLQSAAGYNVYVRVWVANADGTWKNLSALSGLDFLEDVEIDTDIDQPIAQCTVRVKRDIGTLSLAPFREDSTLNRRDDGVTYADLIDPGRDFYVETACVAVGGTPLTADWKELFRGIIDDVNSATEPLEFRGRDLGAYIADAWFAEPLTHTWDPAIPLETAVQTVLDEGGMDGRVTTVTLNTPVSPSFVITSFGYDREPVLDAVVRLVQVIGWDVRYTWDATSATWKFTLQDPGRSTTTPDATFAASQYIDVTNLTIDRTTVRNSVTIKWGPANARQARLYEDGTSISRFKQRSIVIEEADDSPIDTGAEADALGAAVLSDLANPKAEQSVEMLFFWPTELNDLYRFSPNGVHYSVDEDLAVVRIRHVLGARGGGDGGVKHRTILDVRGKPSSGYTSWIARAAKGKPPQSNPTDLVGLAMQLHRHKADDATVELDVSIADGSPDPQAAIVVSAVGQGVGGIVAEDGSQSAIMGTRGNLVAQARDVTKAPWVNRTVSAVSFDSTVTAPDGTLGVSKLVATGAQMTGIQLATGNFNTVQLTSRVWLKASGALSASYGLMTDADAAITPCSETVSLTTEWKEFELTGTVNVATTALQYFLQANAAGTIYAWGMTAVRGALADVTDDLDTTDFVRFKITRPDRQVTATNLVLESDTLSTTPTWFNGGTVTDGIGPYAGHLFARIATPSANTVRQGITLPEDGDYYYSILIRADGAATGALEVQLVDATAAVSRAAITITIGPGGVVTATGALSPTVTALDDGVYRVESRVTGCIAANTNRFYANTAFGGATVSSFLASGCRLTRVPFPDEITTTSKTVTATAESPSGLVSFVAKRNGISPVSQAVMIEPNGVLAQPAGLITIEGEATARDGNAQGQVRLLIAFDAQMQEVDLYTSESPTSGGAIPLIDASALAGRVVRQEGEITSDDNWGTEFDIGTHATWYRQVSAWIYGGQTKETPSRVPLIKFLEQQAIDVGTPPAGPPSALTVTFSEVNGLQRATLAWTLGDAAASHRVFRNNVCIARLAPGLSALVDDGLDPGKVYIYDVQAVRNGQTSEFAAGSGGTGGGGGGGGGSSGSTTLDPATWADGFPVGGSALVSDNDPYVNIRVVNPNAGAGTEVWMSPGAADSGVFTLATTIPAGSTDTTLFGSTFGITIGETRYFYLVATKAGATDSAASAHEPATFRPDF